MQHSLNQVRMIATDMDGTLLNSQDQMPRDFFDILDQIHKLGILFVIASGRPYPTLAMQFESCMDKLVFMAENGGCLVNGDHLVHQDILDTDALSYLLGRCRQVPGAIPILSGFKTAYLFDQTSDDARKEIGRYYKKVQYIHDISEIDAPVSKVTVCDFKGAESNSFPALSVHLLKLLWPDTCGQTSVLPPQTKAADSLHFKKNMIFHRMKPWFSETISMIMK